MRQALRAAGARAGKGRGFTLIELLIVLAVVAILAVSAVASYDFAVVKTRRAAAKGCLTEAAQYMERYFTTNLKYTGAGVPTCSADVTDHYRVEFSATPDASTYALQAVPTGAQARADTLCGTLSVNQAGTRGATGNGGTDACW
jgi:type IV pilus assembly protein PilE